MNAFITGEDIETREHLFGRDNVIDTLISFAKRHEIAGIVAPRRFGKTCILKTMRTILKDIDCDAYPVYFSAHDYGVSNNTDEVYCRLAAVVATQMCKDGILPEGDFNLYRKTVVTISKDEIDNLESLSALTSERQRQAVFKLAEYFRGQTSIDKYILLLLDEIDYMLLTAFESPDDFQRIRGEATKNKATTKFWVAGPASWKTMCNSVGSPGLNCGLQNISLLPLEYSDFSTMWETECSLIEDEELREKSKTKKEYAYKKSGGIPFYAKFIGRQYQIIPEGNEEPTFMILRDYLKEMFENRFFSQDEVDCMKDLAKKPINYGANDPEGIKLLIEKGLAKKAGEFTELTMGYLIDYIRTTELEVPSTPTMIVQDSNQTMINELVRSINDLMGNINETYRLKRNKLIFEAAPETTLSDDCRIKVICTNQAEFGDFLSVIYLMFYERSKAERSDTNTMQPGQRLYEAETVATGSSGRSNFKGVSNSYRNRIFFQILEPLRAAYDAHYAEKLERQTGQCTQADALIQLKGNCNAPENHEWVTLQIKMLDFFKKELEVIKDEVNSIPYVAH